MEYNLFLIVGCGRSGTTLLQSICNQHPQVYIGPETKFTFHFPPQLDLSSPQVYRQSYAKIMSIAAHEEMLLNHFEYFWQQAECTHAGLFKAWLQSGAFHKKEKIRSIGDASNIHTAHILWWVQQIPNLKVIHLWRDPRDVAASQKRIWNTSLTRFAMRYWRAFYIHQQAQKQIPNQYYSLHYEDLVNNPEQSIRALCHAMEWEFHPAMRSPHERSMKGFASRETHKQGTLKAIDPSYVQRYKKTLTPQEIKYIEHLCRSPMKSLGYTPDTSAHQVLPYINTTTKLIRELKDVCFEQLNHRLKR